jgi:hypothetical protein
MVRPAGPAIYPSVKLIERPDVIMFTPLGRKQPDEEPDKAWLWIVGSVIFLVLGVSIVLYARARDCAPLSAAAPPEIALLVCTDKCS